MSDVNPAKYHDRLQSLGRVVYDMERTGVPIDLGVCREIEEQANTDECASKAELDRLAGEVCGRVTTNWSYPKWLAEFLHGPRPTGLNLPRSPYWKKGSVKPGETKTDERALEWLGRQNPEHAPLLKRLGEARRQRRMKKYAQQFRELAIVHSDGVARLHPAYGMASDADDRPGAKTGRFGIKNPPLQQVPRDKKKDPYRLRRAFVAPPGKVLLVADYSQLEIVVLAHICFRLFGARELQRSIDRGAPDLHSATAKFVFGDVLGHVDMVSAPVETIKTSPTLGWRRDKIKEVRYGLNYRKGAWGFGSTLFDSEGQALGEETAQQMIDALLQMHPEIGAFQEWVDDYVGEHLGMWSLQGRWGPFPAAGSQNKWERKRAQRQASNWPMQAGAQEIVAAAMIELHKIGFRLTLQVHDELHALVDEDKADAAINTMQEVMQCTTPLDAYLKAVPAAGKSWEACK